MRSLWDSPLCFAASLLRCFAASLLRCFAALLLRELVMCFGEGLVVGVATEFLRMRADADQMRAADIKSARETLLRVQNGQVEGERVCVTA